MSEKELDYEVEEGTKEAEENQDQAEEKKKQETTTVTVQEMQRRLAGQKQKMEQEMTKLKSDMAKMQMTEEERKAAEESEKDETIAELTARINKMTVTTKASATLSEKGYAATEELLDILVKDDEEATEKAIAEFDRVVKSIINEKMKAAARQEAPKGGNKEGLTSGKSGSLGERLAKNSASRGADKTDSPFK